MQGMAVHDIIVHANIAAPASALPRLQIELDGGPGGRWILPVMESDYLAKNSRIQAFYRPQRQISLHYLYLIIPQERNPPPLLRAAYVCMRDPKASSTLI